MLLTTRPPACPSSLTCTIQGKGYETANLLTCLISIPSKKELSEFNPYLVFTSIRAYPIKCYPACSWKSNTKKAKKQRHKLVVFQFAVFVCFLADASKEKKLERTGQKTIKSCLLPFFLFRHCQCPQLLPFL